MDTTVVPHRITLRSGHRVLVRVLRPDDARGLAEGFGQLSETSRYRRFFTAKPHLSEQSLAFLLCAGELVGYCRASESSGWATAHMFADSNCSL